MMQKGCPHDTPTRSRHARGQRPGAPTTRSRGRAPGAAVLLLAMVAGLGLAEATALAQNRGNTPAPASQQRQPASPSQPAARQALLERERQVRLNNIRMQKENLKELRASYAETGTPSQEDLQNIEQLLYDMIVSADLDPVAEFEDIGGFMFITPEPARPARSGAAGGDGALTPESVGSTGQLATGAAGETLELNFGEPVSLLEFARFVARALNVNIFADPSLDGQTLEFLAPARVPRESLMDLLAALVEERGFVLLHDRLGFYKIEVRDAIPPGFGENEKHATTRMIPTPMVRASQLAALVDSMFSSSMQSKISLTPMDDLGILVVSGPPRVLDNVEDAINRFVRLQLDQQYFHFQLEFVSAEFARDRLMVVIGENGDSTSPATVVPRPTGGTAQAAAAASRQSMLSGGGGSLANLSGRLIIGPGNTLIFRGDPTEARFIAEMLKSIDGVSRLTARRYTAGSVAEQAAFAASEMGLGPVTYADQLGSGSSPFGASRPGVPGRPGIFGGADDQASTISGSKLVLDLQNGTIVYHGTESQHAIFKELVEQFVDDAVQDETIIRTYKIDNVNVVDLADMLQQLIDDQQRLSSSPLFPGQRGSQTGQSIVDPRSEENPAIAEALANDPLSIGLLVDPAITRIIPYETRNELIIKAKPSAQRQFASLIDQLDQRQPQVQLDVKIISVSMSNTFNWGADLQANFGDFFSFSTFGVTEAPANPFDPPGFNVNNSGIVAGIIDTDTISLVVQALETLGDTRLVSNPSIIVNDNQEANFNSTRKEPYATTSQGGDSTITGQGGTTDAGTKLTVTPQISSGGYINLQYQIELSSFDLGARQPGLSPPTQVEQYTSIVTLPSDSTIVVGGFKQSNNSDNESRVPLLGSLPIVGNLFKSREVQRQERTIFVFITPRILDHPRFADLRLITDGPRAEAQIAPDIPPLESVRIPINPVRRGARTAPDRVLPENLLPLHTPADAPADAPAEGSAPPLGVPERVPPR
jgi:type II secretory pathway component GspD/PulD (secretin)